MGTETLSIKDVAQCLGLNRCSINGRFYYFLNSIFTVTKTLTFLELILCACLLCKALFKIHLKELTK